VGECAAHRGIAYGLVAPLFEQAKVCATHLAQFGIGRYTGSTSSTKLKVTGIDLFSAGNFMPAARAPRRSCSTTRGAASTRSW
jgi:nitrite reductase (NADH) large subunit